MKKLYFIRHGQAEANLLNVVGGRIDSPLTDKGRAQAHQVAKNAKGLNIDYIVSSPQSRAYETAKIIAQEISYPVKKIHINKLFMERDYGQLEGQPWAPDLDLDGMSDVESKDSLLERAKLALDFLMTIEADTVLVVSHGSFGRALRHHILEDMSYSSHHTPDAHIPNAEIINWV